MNNDFIIIEPFTFDEFFTQLLIKANKPRLIKSPNAAKYLIEAASRLYMNLEVNYNGELCLPLDNVIACYNEDYDGVVLYSR